QHEYDSDEPQTNKQSSNGKGSGRIRMTDWGRLVRNGRRCIGHHHHFAGWRGIVLMTRLRCCDRNLLALGSKNLEASPRKQARTARACGDERALQFSQA
ncbi:MAG: hypothetical protein ACYTDV_12060, partial [Planctomycetota bacterium]